MKYFITLFITIIHIGLFAQDTLYFEIGFRDHNDSANVIAATSDTSVINTIMDQLLLPEDERMKHINGVINYGSSYNNDLYNWHYTKNLWSMADISIEVCDGDPFYVNQHVAYFVDTVGRFCPYNSFVKNQITSTSTDARDRKQLFTIYPNPTEGMINIYYQGRQSYASDIQIINGQGQIMLSFHNVYLDYSNQFDIRELESGLYILRISWQDGQNAVNRLIARL